MILVWNMITIRKKTNTSFNLTEIFLKPVICALSVYFITDCIKTSFCTGLSDMLTFIICAFICIFCYLILLFLFKSISFNEIKGIK
ncbi:MAG: hypothetical protein ACI4IQ_00710 [Eubacterium sp.]